MATRPSVLLVVLPAMGAMALADGGTIVGLGPP